MSKWYDDKDILEFGKKADEALDSKCSVVLLEVAEICEEKAKEENIHPLVAARLLYYAFTCFSNINTLLQENDSIEHIISICEEYTERAIACARRALEFYEVNIVSFTMTEDEQIQTIAFYVHLAINYSNLTFECARIIESIEILSQPILKKNPLVKGFLGVLFCKIACLYWDSNHNFYILHKAYKLLQTSISKKNVLYNENQVELFTVYEKYCYNLFVDKNELSSELPISEFIMPYEELSTDEEDYRAWIAKNKLALNLLNDLETSIGVGYDPLYLPNMTASIESKIPPLMQSLFNQIKQEYVSARFTIYEGVNENKVHYSDKNVTLINTLDFSIYSLSIEKIKFGFRACYSILDSIAFLMNKYFDLKIPLREISYLNLWGNNSKNKTKLLELAKENYPLLGLWWIYKDIRSSYTSEYKPNTEKFTKIRNIRNAMEHRSLKVVRYPFDSEVSKTLDSDNLSYKISFEEFNNLTLELFKYVRETIIMLVFAMQVNEENKEKTSKDFIMEINCDEYLDEEKLIF